MQCNIQENNVNRMKRTCYPLPLPMGDDRISSLPDEICSHILSLLPTIDGVKTSILSKRWRYMWTRVSYLDFNFHNFPKIKRRKAAFAEFVKRSLLCHDGFDIRKFGLSLETYNSLFPYAYDWISFAVRHNVKEVDLHVPKVTLDQLPHMLFNSESLTVLKLNLPNNVLELPASVCLSGLRTLHLASLAFNDDSGICKLISSCPILENLSILWCNLQNILILNICAHKLRHLRITECDCLHNCVIKIFAPSLHSFNYAGVMPHNFSLENLFSLTNVSIDFHGSIFSRSGIKGYYTQELTNILRGFDNARVLTLSASSIEYLSQVQDFRENAPTKLWNMRHLKLSMWRDKSYIQLIARLLKSCPNLESLSVATVVSLPILLRAQQTVDQGNVKLLPSCDLCHLKTVEMKQFEGANKVEVVKYLIEHAPALEKITTITRDRKVKQSTFDWLKNITEPCGSSPNNAISIS